MSSCFQDEMCNTFLYINLKVYVKSYMFTLFFVIRSIKFIENWVTLNLRKTGCVLRNIDEYHLCWDKTLHVVLSCLPCIVCLRRRTRSITNEWSPGWSVMCCCHGITQGHLCICHDHNGHDLVSPAEWWSFSWAAPWWRWGGGHSVDGLGAGLQTADVSECT